jgi:hypothetical protein
MGSDLDRYSDAELGRMLKAASRSREFARRESISNFEAFCNFLSAAGLGFIANAITLAKWAWERIRGLWSSVIRADYTYCGKGDGCDCGLPKVCDKVDCNCSRIKVCANPDCKCSRLKVCKNLNCSCSLPKAVF